MNLFNEFCKILALGRLLFSRAKGRKDNYTVAGTRHFWALIFKTFSLPATGLVIFYILINQG